MARSHTPGAASAQPMAMEIQVGSASQMYPMAKTNPSGTRMRCAMRDHVISKSWSWLQQPARSFAHFRCGGVSQAFMLTVVMLVIRLAGFVAYDLERRIERPVARGIRRPEDGDDRHA